MRNSSGHQCKVKMSSSEKKVNKKRYDISSVKRVTKKFLEVSLVVVQNNGEEMYKKSVLHVLDLLLFFTVLRRCMPSPLSILYFV